jgi:hypothetical protein
MGASLHSSVARLSAVAIAAGLAGSACAGTARPRLGERFPYESGERVVVQGVVADGTGAPLADLDVVLEASNAGLGIYPPGRRKRQVTTGGTRTDARGAYALELTWNGRFDHFELVVGTPVATPPGETLQELSRVDITRRVRQGSPVAVPVTLQDTTFLSNLRAFLASLQTADEQRVYRETGKPDRVDDVRFPDREETAWWYFRLGKVFRFNDGRLEKVEDFPPVEPL